MGSFPLGPVSAQVRVCVVMHICVEYDKGEVTHEGHEQQFQKFNGEVKLMSIYFA